MILVEYEACSSINRIALKSCSRVGAGTSVEVGAVDPLYGSAPIMPLAWDIVSSHAR
ncbi:MULTISPECIES: hypothetical protein [Methylobacterium]|uniref:hypothetical protein n=1 Tax=Methylobacterium TaxID=407 RepID=UPI002F360BF9